MVTTSVVVKEEKMPGGADNTTGDGQPKALGDGST
jgi:hypothetical protein